MQILKEEVRENILQAATLEFRDKGYHRASIRAIAKKAGMTEGNVYRYFKNKEHLLQEVVQPTYLRIIDLIHKVPNNMEEEQKIDFSWLVEYVMKPIVEISKIYHNQLLILIDGVSGTKYEKAKDEIIELIEERINNFFRILIEQKSGKIQNDFLSHVIAKGFVDGSTQILRELQNKDEMEKVLSQYYQFYFRNLAERFL